MIKADRIKRFHQIGEWYMSEEEVNKLSIWLDSHGFFDAPASTKYHGSYDGGLFDHSMEMFNALRRMTENEGLIWEKTRSPFIISMLHDMCKADQYRKTEDGYAYVKQTLFTGHGEKSLMILLTAPIKLTVEEAACIRYHMGAFVEKEQWGDYTNAIHQYNNVLWTHQADMFASHVLGV